MSSEKGFTPLLIILVITAGIGIFVAGAYFASNFEVTQKNDKEEESISIKEMFTPVPTGSSTTITWKTYVNTNPEFRISYPSDWNINNSTAEIPEGTEAYSSELVVYKDNYQVVFSFPSAYGPSRCIFDDQDDLKNEYAYAGYCEGEYTEFGDEDSRHRRLDSPDRILDNIIGWNVYTKDENSELFVTVPPVAYIVPSGYDKSIVDIMDEIVTRSLPAQSQ